MNAPTRTPDPDVELDAYYENIAHDVAAGLYDPPRGHRCPPDMPPCPECQAREEEEDEREFGNQ